MKRVFVGTGGIRSGWRLLIFFTMICGLIIAFQNIAMHLPHVGDTVVALSKGTFGPLGGLVNEGVFVCAMFIGMWVMTKIERSQWASTAGILGARGLLAGSA